MSVYVDALRDWGWKYGPSCHLFADTNEELHAFAARLGLKRKWFQARTGPHYDLTAKKRELAVGLGAIEATDREMVEHFRRWRLEFRERLDACQSPAEMDEVRKWFWR